MEEGYCSGTANTRELVWGIAAAPRVNTRDTFTLICRSVWSMMDSRPGMDG